MTSDTPGSGAPGWGQPPNSSGQQPAAGEWPAELVPPPEAPAAATVPEAAEAVVPGAGVPAPAAPELAASAPMPATPEPVPPPVAQPAWVAPPAQPPQSGQPPAPGHGAPLPPAAAGGGQWGAPPQQPGAWPPPSGSPGTPGGPPVGWQPAPAKSSNGCLKACLIVGIILVILAVVFFTAITILGMKFASDIGINADGSVQECSFVSNAELADVLGGQPTGLPLGGFVDATIGQVLDKRLLVEAEDCWLVDESGSGGSYTGRLAFQRGGSFEQEQALAEGGAFLAATLTGYGDQAFCTGIAETGSTGALVGQGGDLAYVSLISSDVEGFDFTEGSNGVLYSPAACEQAAAIAAQILR